MTAQRKLYCLTSKPWTAAIIKLLKLSSAGTPQVKGPSGEEFNTPHEFMEMLQKYAGKYEVKKVFVDRDDVCLIYNFSANGANVLMCSWYQLQKGKITSIQTIFDPSPFSQVADSKPRGSY
ncbi:MAG TPA: hypothetical protein VN739_10130 [Nitrososphaerales archaeon]|nr:hypothetical protein [Nitrososphaerales archaeon]